MYTENIVDADIFLWYICGCMGVGMDGWME